MPDFTIDLNYPEYIVPKDQARFFLAVCRDTAWNMPGTRSPIPHTYLIAGFTDLRTNTQHILTRFGKNPKKVTPSSKPTGCKKKFQELKGHIWPLEFGEVEAGIQHENHVERNHEHSYFDKVSTNMAYKAYQISYTQYQEVIAQLQHIEKAQNALPDRFDPTKYLMSDRLEYDTFHYYYNQNEDTAPDYHFVYSPKVFTPEELEVLYNLKLAAYGETPQYKHFEDKNLVSGFFNNPREGKHDPNLWNWPQLIKADYDHTPNKPEAIIAAAKIKLDKPFNVNAHQHHDLAFNNCKRFTKDFMVNMNIHDPKIGATSAYDMPENCLRYAEECMDPFLITYPINPLPAYAKRSPLQFEALHTINKKIHAIIKSIDRKNLTLNALKKTTLIELKARSEKKKQELFSFREISSLMRNICRVYPQEIQKEYLARADIIKEKVFVLTNNNPQFEDKEIITVNGFEKILNQQISLESETLQQHYAWNNFNVLISENVKSKNPLPLAKLTLQLPANEIALLEQDPLFKKINTIALYEEIYHTEVRKLKNHCIKASPHMRKEATKVLTFAQKLYTQQNCSWKKIIQVLQNTNNLLDNFQQQHLMPTIKNKKKLHKKCLQYRALAEKIHASTHWSAWLGSAMLMLLGTIMCTAGLTSAIVSGGLTMTVSTGLCVGGALTFFGGAKLLSDKINTGALTSDSSYQKTKLNRAMKKLSNDIQLGVTTGCGI